MSFVQKFMIHSLNDVLTRDWKDANLTNDIEEHREFIRGTQAAPTL